MAKFVKNSLLITSLLAMGALGTVLIAWAELRSPELESLQSASFTSEQVFTLNQQTTGTYEQSLTYTSELIPAAFDYDALSAKWQGKLPSGTAVLLQVKNSADSAWQKIEVDEDDQGTGDSKNSELILWPKAGDKLQYQLVLQSSDSKVTPQISNLKFFYFRSAAGPSVHQKANILKALQADAKNSSDLHIISRAEWDAAEAYRVYNETNPPAQITEERDQEDTERFANELKISKIVTQNEDGEDLTWPLEYPAKVREFIIHHTATKTYPKTLEESMATVRDIYYWHTLVKGWGDIGYNYLIDPLGNIFEGRAGQDGVVGGHAAANNTGSIGISFIGNYSSCEQLYTLESEDYAKCLADDPEFAAHELSPEAKQAAIDLIAYKSALFKINPAGKGSWRGQVLPKIVGHLNVGKTRCPGQNVMLHMEDIREQAATKYFEILPNITTLDLSNTYDYSEPEIPLYAAASDGIVKKIEAQAGELITIALPLKNTGRMEWLKKSYWKPLHDFEVIKQLTFEHEQLDKMIAPGERGIFQVKLQIAPTASGSYSLSFVPFLNGKQELKQNRVNILLKIKNSTQESAVLGTESGGPEQPDTFLSEVATVLTTNKSNTELGPNPTVRIWLSKFKEDTATLSSTTELQLTTGTDTVTSIETGQSVQVSLANLGLKVIYKGKSLETLAPVRLTGTTVTVDNLEAHPAWNPSLNDNTFRQTLELRNSNGKLLLINELPLEDYLKGVAEVPTGEPIEKMKALSVAMRNYIYQYLSPDNRKFPGTPYDGSDDPNVFQKYLGYNFELRTPDWLSAVAATTGKMLTYEDRVVKTPYFNESDGRTRSAAEVWGWTNTPYLESVPDPLCTGGTLKGHGVGLSGCGAREAAKRGKLYPEILNYYYPKLTLSQIY